MVKQDNPKNITLNLGGIEGGKIKRGRKKKVIPTEVFVKEQLPSQKFSRKKNLALDQLLEANREKEKLAVEKAVRETFVKQSKPQNIYGYGVNGNETREVREVWRVPQFGEITLKLPPFFAVPSQTGNGNITWKLANPLTEMRNLANRKKQLSVNLKRANVKKAELDMSVPRTSPIIDDFSAKDQAKLRAYYDAVKEGKEQEYLFKNRPRGFPAVLYKNAKKAGLRETREKVFTRNTNYEKKHGKTLLEEGVEFADKETEARLKGEEKKKVDLSKTEFVPLEEQIPDTEPKTKMVVAKKPKESEAEKVERYIQQLKEKPPLEVGREKKREISKYIDNLKADDYKLYKESNIKKPKFLELVRAWNVVNEAMNAEKDKEKAEKERVKEAKARAKILAKEAKAKVKEKKKEKGRNEMEAEDKAGQKLRRSYMAEDDAKEAKLALERLKKIKEEEEEAKLQEEAKAFALRARARMKAKAQSGKGLYKMEGEGDKETPDDGGCDGEGSAGSLLGKIGKKAYEALVKPKVERVKKNIHRITHPKETLQEAKDFGRHLIKGRHDAYPPSAQKIIDENKDAIVESISLRRTPLSSTYTTLLSWATKGETDKRIKEQPKDTLYHISMWVKLSNGKTIKVEKNEVINMVVNPKRPKEEQVFALTSVPDNLTFGDMLSKTREAVGDHKFFSYSAKDNNCGNFIEYILKTNGMNNQATHDYIGQDAKAILKGFPSLRKVMNTLTDIAGRANVLLEGGGVSDSDSESEMEGGNILANQMKKLSNDRYIDMRNHIGHPALMSDLFPRIPQAFTQVHLAHPTPIGSGLYASSGGSLLDDIYGGARKTLGVGMRMPVRQMGGAIPPPPSRSPITDPSLIGKGMSKGCGMKKGRFVKGSQEAKDYMASIRKKK